MDRLTLSRIDEELDSSEVAALCFLCRDVVHRKRLEKIVDAKGLFLRLEEKGLLENHLFLSELLRTIRRADLLNLLETDSRRPEETDSNPMLSDYRVLLYRIYEDLTKENLDKLKFLLIDITDLGRRQVETCNTALDVFAEMERTGSLSNTKVDVLHNLLLELDQQLASTVQDYRLTQVPQPRTHLHVSMDHQNINNTPQPEQASLPVPLRSPSQPSDAGQSIYSDAELCPVSPSLYDETEYYALNHNPRGMCVVINNEKFLGKEMRDRAGTQKDEYTLRKLFTRLGFTMVVYNDLTADDMRRVLKELGTHNFRDHDALVVCVLSHGEIGCVFGTDEEQVLLRELTQPFTSGRAPTLVGKPKLFFIQACQGSGYQSCIPVPNSSQEKDSSGSRLEEDAGRVYGETVPSDADFLLGMATVPEYKSFRNTSTGSIYIQELCAQLEKSAQSPEKDDILSVLTRVNREVSKGEFLRRKQMPEPKYTLTKKLVLKFV